jgi:hypothetical protein
MGRTLVVERHDWETSGSGHQIQFPMAAFAGFFLFPGDYLFRIFDPPASATPSRQVKARVSAYGKSSTNRLNRITEIGQISQGFVLIEEFVRKGEVQHYEIWWFTGKQAQKLFAKPWNWNQARASQYGPGRYWTILNNRGPRVV